MDHTFGRFARKLRNRDAIVFAHDSPGMGKVFPSREKTAKGDSQ
jgi:alpha-beta hydrolase superfamily lysophospholipase